MLILLTEHWVISQATFVIRVNLIDYLGNPNGGWTTSGYSIIPCIIGEVKFIYKFCLLR